MSRHLPECAGDDYCAGYCLRDGIPQPSILMRASDISCSCDWRLLYHKPDCPDSPLFWKTLTLLKFNPQGPPFFSEMPISNTWNCIKHGLLGNINGPIHYEVCNG